jgi:hypothetical protein
MPEKVEKIESGTPREFSAIKGQGKASTGPSGKDYADKKAIPTIKDHNENK